MRLTYSWARPTILATGKDRKKYFYLFCFFTSIHFPLSSLCLPFISSTMSSISLLPFSGRHKMTHEGWRVVKPQHNQKVPRKCQTHEAQHTEALKEWEMRNKLRKKQTSHMKPPPHKPQLIHVLQLCKQCSLIRCRVILYCLIIWGTQSGNGLTHLCLCVP